MDRKLVAGTSWVLVSGTLLLGGCMTPGLQHQDPPGFSATFQQFDPHWQAVTGHDGPRYVTPARMELETQDVPELSSQTDAQHEEVLTP